MRKMSKDVIMESHNYIQKKAGYSARPGSIVGMASDQKKWDMYVESLSEGLTESEKVGFKILSKNVQQVILENSISGTNIYETLMMPILRVYYPRSIMKEFVTNIPMATPEITKYMLRAKFKRNGDSNIYMAPYVPVSGDPGVTSGSAIKAPLSAATIDFPGTTDLLDKVSLNSEQAHLERVFTIRQLILADGTTAVTVNMTADIDGNLVKDVVVAGSTYTVSGKVDYFTGKVTLSATDNTKFSAAVVDAVISLEENTINSKVELVLEKIRIFARDRQIQTNFSLQFQQDLKSLFQADAQAELAAAMADQLLLEVESELFNTILTAGLTMTSNVDRHVKTFNCTVPEGFSFGPKEWRKNIQIPLSQLSAGIYNDTNIGQGNVIACNPLDAVVLESMDDFKYVGNAVDGGAVTAGDTIATGYSNKWKFLVSSFIPQGKMVMVHKPEEAIKAIFLFCPYVPAVFTPYPLGAKPSMSLLSRYGSQIIRPDGIAVLNITGNN